MSGARSGSGVRQLLARLAGQATRWVSGDQGTTPAPPGPRGGRPRTGEEYWMVIAMAGERVFVPCDRCGHRSARDYVDRDAHVLSLCEHHSRQHHDALERAGFRCLTVSRHAPEPLAAR